MEAPYYAPDVPPLPPWYEALSRVLVIKVLLILGLAVAVAVAVAAAREAGVRFTALLHHGMRVRYRQVCVRPTNRRRRLVGDLQVGGKEMSVAGSWQVWSDVGYDNWA